MAIYRKGAASLDKNGIITGVGTNWKTSLSLIRPGATMVFASNPAVYVTISEVVSDTELRAVDTGRKVVAEPTEYVIFLHDSLTVDGLAQDVAETLRYYQGKENEFAHFIEIVKSLDMEEIEKVIQKMQAEVEKFEENYKLIQQTAQEVEDNANDVKANLQLSNAAAALAQQYRDEAEEQKNQAQQHAGEAAQSVDDCKAQVQLAANQVSLAQAEVQKAKDVVAGAKTEIKQEVSDIVANAKQEVQQEASEIVASAKEEVKQEASEIVSNAKQEVVSAAQEKVDAASAQADRAATERQKAEEAVVAAGNKAAFAEEQSEMAQIAANEAERQANASEASRAKAEGEANRAKGYADEIKDIGLSLDATNLLRKDKNLEELTDKQKARENLELDRFHQDPNMTRISSNDAKTELRLGWDSWGVYRTASDSEQGYIPLTLKAGGTGAATAADARVNLQLERIKQFGARTEIVSANGECRLFVGDDSSWGVLNKQSSYIALPVAAGGTGARSINDARKAFKVDLVDQRAEETALMSPDKDHILTIRNDGTWGVWNRPEARWIPLPIDRGGTNARTVQEAKVNLQIDRVLQDSNMTRIKASDPKTELRIGTDDWYVYRDSQDSTGGYLALPVKGGGTGARDIDEARENFGVDRLVQKDTQTYVYAPNKKMKIYVDDNGDWGAYDESTTQIKPLQISRGGTGAADAAGARNMLGVGEGQDVTFSMLHLKQSNGTNGGILHSDNYNSNGVLISQGRFYSEIQGGIGKATIHIAANNKNAYLQYDEDANLSGIGNLRASRVETGSVGCTGSVWAGQGNSIGMNTSDGGNKNIFLQNVGGDGNVGSWVNLLQGNWYNGYWQLGAIRGGGADISAVRLGVNNAGSDWKWFDFNNSYGGHITALRGFKGQCVAGAWTLDSEYMGAPFYADTTLNNDGGYSPVVAGGTRASTGYDIRYSFGAMSGGTGSWSRTAIHMLGDATHHRAFEFFVDGRIYTWDNANQWGGAFEFQRVATSDRDLKKDIEYNDGKASFDNIMKFKPSTFVYKSDKYNRLRRGVIAQDLYEIDPEYVRIIPGAPIIDNEAGTDEEGNLFITDYRDDTLGLDNNVIMIDTALATRYIGGIVEKQAQEIEDLKAKVAKMEEIISKLIKEQI